jgi:DNA transformation protein
MPVSDAFLGYVLEQLAGLGRVASRRMFGGVGLYHGGAFFSIIDDDALFFRVDDATRPAYQALDAGPFAPIPGQQPMRAYYEVPVDILDDRDRLTAWAARAAAVARAVAARKRRTPKRAPRGKRAVQKRKAKGKGKPPPR